MAEFVKEWEQKAAYSWKAAQNKVVSEWKFAWEEWLWSEEEPCAY